MAVSRYFHYSGVTIRTLCYLDKRPQELSGAGGAVCLVGLTSHHGGKLGNVYAEISIKIQFVP